MPRPFVLPAVLFFILLPSAANSDDVGLRRQAADALQRATDFFTGHVATEGGYLWLYGEDLSKREGEGRASDTQVWVQPPGTPSVGMALLAVYHDSKAPRYLEAAKQAGYCLVRGQLRSGGWDYHVDFSPKARHRHEYRVEAPVEGKNRRNTSTLDDDVTQAALRLLMRLDETLGFKDAKIHEAAQYGLETLLKVQYPNGAWPQRFTGPPDAEKFPIKKASYPESWSRTFPGRNYTGYYTFNDNAMGDVIDVMFEAWRTYGDERYRASAELGGNFILLAQMPEPQPAWAQQYDADMHPAWARKFEPPAITGGESHGVMRTLLQLYRQTGDKKYLEPLPPAVAYFRRSRLPGGGLARFYELKTNKPLYFTKKYELTYSDDDVPTHYSFKTGSGINGIEKEYQRLLKLDADQLERQRESVRAPSRPSNGLIKQTKAVIAALDERGRWVDEGPLKYHGPDDPTRRIISCRTFINNVRVLGQYLASTAE